MKECRGERENEEVVERCDGREGKDFEERLRVKERGGNIRLLAGPRRAPKYYVRDI